MDFFCIFFILRSSENFYDLSVNSDLRKVINEFLQNSFVVLAGSYS